MHQVFPKNASFYVCLSYAPSTYSRNLKTLGTGFFVVILRNKDMQIWGVSSP